MVASPPADWRFESRLPWPGVRGRRLWHHVTSAGKETAHATTSSSDNSDDDANNNDDDDDDENDPIGTSRRRRSSLAVPSAVRYDVEMCESTAGHIALVLLRRDASVSSSPPSAATTNATAAAAQLAIPRVLYVVDAVPPKRASTLPAQRSPLKRHSAVEPRWTMLAADARAHSFAGATSALTASAEGVATPSLVFSSVPPQQQHVDELALVEELFTTSRATKDACILAKPPLLCARFDCRLVAVQFSRRLDTSASPLRCVVAREDGMCYIWEWSSDLHTWSFLNRFCFLENPNLKWTRPVVLFAATHCRAWDSTPDVETTELAWWSAETTAEPKLFVRKIQFGVQKNTFRTEMHIGSAFHVAAHARDVVALHRSPLGLWIVSRTDGVRLRSGATLQGRQLDWASVWGKDLGDGAATHSCVHSVTGELIVLHGESGRVVVVASPTQLDGHGALVRKPLFTLQRTDPKETDRVDGLAAHRQLLLVLLATRVAVYSVVSGERLVSLALPTGQTALTLWSSSSTSARAGASAVGLVGARGYWQLRTPSGRALVQMHSTTHALGVARPYGPTLSFDAARVALDLLQSARAIVEPSQTSAWDAAVEARLSPALLLATLPRANGLAILHDMAELVSALYRVTHELLTTGRLATALDKRDDERVAKGLPLATPATVASLPHLANWVLLATRELARLRGAVVHKGTRHIRARTVSALSTFAEDDDDVKEDMLNDPAATSMPAAHDDPDQDDQQLSRKLRPMTSLQFAAGSSALRHGAQWLEQLESLLLHERVPHPLLFHAERSLADFQLALSSFSKHMYLESMARLYVIHKPHKLLAFVGAVAQFAPRSFSLSQDPRVGVAVTRTHAERALLLLPPASSLVKNARREVSTKVSSLSVSVSSSGRKKWRAVSTDEGERSGPTPAKSTLLVYTELLCLCGHTLEACRVLLDAGLYDECVARLLLVAKEGAKEAVTTAVFFLLLEYCVAHRSAADLESLLAHKPSHVDVLVVLRALRQLLPLQMVTASSDASSVVSVGALRTVLLRLVRDHAQKAK